MFSKTLFSGSFFPKAALWPVLSLLFAGAALAQPANKFVTNSVMPSPNAASLGKYGDVPVSYFTGVPDISVPVHTVQEGPLALPISLNYHASGIKVAEMASWVGLGWSLNAGGMISRTVQGIPDETGVYGYYTTGSTMPADLATTSDYTKIYGIVFPAAKGDYDTEPDIFSFNVGGYSGKFYIDHKDAHEAGKPNYNFIPKQDLKLEFNTDFTKFVLVGTDGTRYTFGQTEGPNGTAINAREYTHQQGEPNTKTYCSGWYLLKIESADLKYAINLTYADESYTYMNSSPCKYVAHQQACQPGPPPAGVPTCTGNALDFYHYTFTTEMAGKRLTGITSSTETLTFTANTQRLDLDAYNAGQEPKRLDEIVISSGTPQYTCKKFILGYDYFQDPADLSRSHYKRLRLKTAGEQSCDGAISVPPHVFTYEGDFVPHRFSKATDHWGFYNGVTPNETKQVSIPPTTIHLPNGTVFTYGSADKESNEAAMKLGALTQITYPTGGTTTFSFEANRVNTPVSIPTVKVKFSSCNLGSIGNCCDLTSNTSQTVSFTAQELVGANFDLSLSNIPANSGFPPPTCSQVPDLWCQVEAFHEATGQSVGVYEFNAPNKGITQWVKQVPLHELEDYLHFEPQEQYYFVLTARDAYAEFTLYTLSNTYQNRLVGGLRIKEIRNHDGMSAANDMVRTYDYVQESDPAVSSGLLFKNPVYAHYIEGIAYRDDVSYFGQDYPFVQLVFSEQSVVPLSNFEGFHCGYKYVKENLNGNGWKKYTFFSQQSTQANANQYPRPPDNINIGLGKMEDEKTYAQTGDLLARTLTYKTQPNSSFNAAPIYKITSLSFPCFWEGKPGDDGQPIQIGHTVPFISPYTILTDAYKIDYTVETLDGVTATTHYFYDAADRFQMPVATQTVNSDNKVTRTEHLYAHDYPAGCIRSQLLGRNLIGSPWQTVVKVGGVQVSGQRTEYAAFTLGGGGPNGTNCPAGSFPRPYRFYNYDAILGSGNGYWDLAGTLEFYTDRGMPSSFRAGNTAANWPAENYTWSSAGLIQTRNYLDFTWSYDYHPGTRLVSKITDKDGQETWFDYDPLSRLSKGYARPGAAGDKNTANVKKEYTYQYRNGATPNNIRTKTVYTPVAGSNLTETEEAEYLDGLGRTIQQVSRKASPQLRDVAVATRYDNQGRVVSRSIPYHATGNTGDYLPNFPVGEPAAVTEYEASPLNRPKGVTPPAWYKTTTEYGTNTTALTHVDGTQYPPNSLVVTTVTDPNGNKTLTFKDKKGRTVLTRRSDATGGQTADTYNKYDDKDRLVTVYPPGAAPNTPELLFLYQYDESDNLIVKKMPDKGAEFMVYDVRDLQTNYQDERMKKADPPYSMLTQYDDYGRAIATGFSQDGYNFSEVLTETTYEPSTGRVLRTRAKILDEPRSETWTEKNFTYDNYGRVSGTAGNNHLSSETVTVDAYDFMDNVLLQMRTHYGPTTLTVQERKEYDHRGRLKEHYHGINGGTEVRLAAMTYNYRGFLTRKSLGRDNAGDALQDVDFSYNEQGWLTAINDFCEEPPVEATAPAASVSNLNIQVSFNAPAWQQTGHAEAAHLRVAVSGAIGPTETAPAPFSLERAYALQYRGTDTARLSPVAFMPQNMTLPQGFSVPFGGTVHADTLADFYLELERRVLSEAKALGMGQHGTKWATAVQKAVEAALRPLGTHAAAGAATAAMSQPGEPNGTPRPDLFAMGINYGAAVPALNAPQSQNGNITSIAWQLQCNDPKFYGFSYDFLDRMTKGTYAVLDRSANAFVDLNAYNEEVIGGTPYDLRGNIQGIERRGFLYSWEAEWGVVDYLTYTYAPQSNRLVNIRETAVPWLGFRAPTEPDASYGYDENGNMVSDGHKKMDVTYNHLNLPRLAKLVPYYDQEGGQRNIEWLYDAAGNKLRKTTEWETIDYCEGIEYKGGLLDAIYHAEGRAVPQGEGFLQNYTIRDHLGNTRVVFFSYLDPNNSEELVVIAQAYEYYPFGLFFNAGAEGPPYYPYTYNHKEWNGDYGLDWYDYGARWYDAAVGRWWSVDDMAGEPEQVGQSPYQYGWNNPVKLTDPDGNCPKCVKALAKTLAKSVAKGKLDLGEVHDIVDAVKTLADPSSSLLDKGLAVFDLVSPVSSKEIKAVANVVEGASDTKKAANAVNSVGDAAKSSKVPNPHGSKGKPDHQEKIDELAKKAENENPGKRIVTEKKIQGHDSNRRPDVQVVDPDSQKTVKIYEAERNPSGKRNKAREAEYNRLNIPQETHKVGN